MAVPLYSDCHHEYCYGSSEASSDTSRESDSTDAYMACMGLRRTINPRTEIKPGISFTRSTEGGSFAGTGGQKAFHNCLARLLRYIVTITTKLFHKLDSQRSDTQPMKNILAIGVSALAYLVSTATSAQDLMDDAGSVTRSYNYIEGFYLLNLEDDLPDGAAVDFPALFRVSVDLNEKYSLYGEYINQSYSLSAGGETGGLDLETYELNVRYRDTFNAMANTDWVAGLGYGYIVLDLFSDTAGSLISDNSGFYNGYVGLRRTISQRLEGEIGIDFFRLTDGGSFEGTGEVALVYRVSPRLDIAFGGVDLTDANNYGIGLRYTWN